MSSEAEVEREEGYYYVRVQKDLDWEPAQWAGDCWIWEQMPVSVYEVGPRIPTMAELEQRK